MKAELLFFYHFSAVTITVKKKKLGFFCLFFASLSLFVFLSLCHLSVNFIALLLLEILLLFFCFLFCLPFLNIQWKKIQSFFFSSLLLVCSFNLMFVYLFAKYFLIAKFFHVDFFYLFKNHFLKWWKKKKKKKKKRKESGSGAIKKWKNNQTKQSIAHAYLKNYSFF